ncbi:NAD-P-binding protein [Trametes versicolor FP-101664 SS1]|uniref:NAD-P-binding protein n=1 Tax=Trametes versicolor (strain FP-101664) TaxID=717944 RepID=UPI00046233F5|nr:NAD-P-binding protein [Trametes versicolor FP-101664 SS1]EIW54625.1 NAD-P-binding protein [Trametes versicolor FP-101664 SS1]
MSSTTRQTTWLITGASRGIGLELTRQLLESPNNLVIAACRTPEKATALSALKSSAKGTLHVVKLQVDEFDSIRALPKAIAPILGDGGLDYLINNAGILKDDTPLTLDPEVLLETLRTNTVGPALVTQVAVPFLEKGATKKVLNISSTLGSIASAETFGKGTVTSYSISKAALNMLTYKLKQERPDFIAITLCPGWVKTDMGTQAAQLEPAESVAGILKVITGATAADSGKYLSHSGAVIPW